MVEISDEVMYIGVIGGLVSTVIVRILTFVLKSRCSGIKVCWGAIDCQREVIDSADLEKNVVRDIEIPTSLVRTRNSIA